MDRLLAIAEISHKYHFASIGSWAMGAIVESAQRPAGVMSDPSSARYTRILELAIRCQHMELRDVILEKWVEQLFGGLMPPLAAMPVADKYGLHQLQGAAYYVTLVKMDSVRPSYFPRKWLTFDAKLSTKQRMQLLSGHWSLVNYSAYLRTTPPVLVQQQQHHQECAYHGCVNSWMSWWHQTGKTEEMLRCGPADVLARLERIHDRLKKDVGVPSPHTICRDSVLNLVTTRIAEFRANLYQHFLI